MSCCGSVLGGRPGPPPTPPPSGGGEAVRLASTADVDLATFVAGDLLDGVATVPGDVVLLRRQTNEAENGVYVVPAVAPAARAPGWLTMLDFLVGRAVCVLEGNYAAGRVYTVVELVPIVDTSPVGFGERVDSNLLVQFQQWDLTDITTSTASTATPGWLQRSSSGTINALDGLAGHPGANLLGSSASGTDARLDTSQATVVLGGGVVWMEFWVRMLQQPTVAENSEAWFGLTDIFGVGASYIDECIVLFGNNRANWHLRTKTAAIVRDDIDTGVPLVAGEWLKGSIHVNADNTAARLFINELLVGTALQLPVGPLRRLLGIKKVTTVASTLISFSVDWVSIRQRSSRF